MRKFSVICVCSVLFAGCLIFSACGNGEKEEASVSAEEESKTVPRSKEQIKRLVQDRVKKAEEKIEFQDEQAAYKTSLKEAKKWDPAARLYYLKGEEDLQSEGTAKQWTAKFAVREDPQNTPVREQGKKFSVLMMGGEIVKAEKKETLEDISYTTPCHAFLPETWMSGKNAYRKCMEALKTEYGSSAANASPQRIELFNGEYYHAPKWEIIPTWRLSMKMDGKPISAAVHAETGKVLKIK